MSGTGMRFVVVGAGGVGAYFGGRLAEAGNDVAFVARGKTLDALRSSGLRITSPLGNCRLPPFEAHHDPTQLAPADAVIVTVKAWQVAPIAPQLEPLLRPDGYALPLQNGVDAPGELAAALGRHRVLGGLCRIISKLEEPGHVLHVGATPTIVFGELDDRHSERVQRLSETLTAAGIEPELPESIGAALWQKFLFISAVSGLGAATDLPLGILRTAPETRDLLTRLMREVHDLAIARQIPLPPDVVSEALAFIDTLPPETTASMQRDILAGRPSELAAQTGAVVRLGRKTGVATPTHELLYQLLIPRERQARGEALVGS